MDAWRIFASAVQRGSLVTVFSPDKPGLSAGECVPGTCSSFCEAQDSQSETANPPRSLAAVAARAAQGDAACFLVLSHGACAPHPWGSTTCVLDSSGSLSLILSASISSLRNHPGRIGPYSPSLPRIFEPSLFTYGGSF